MNERWTDWHMYIIRSTVSLACGRERWKPTVSWHWAKGLFGYRDILSRISALSLQDRTTLTNPLSYADDTRKPPKRLRDISGYKAICSVATESLIPNHAF